MKRETNDARSREVERGMKIFETGGVTLPADTHAANVTRLAAGDFAWVKSQSHPGDFYRTNGACGCRAYGRNGHCKHQEAVALALAAMRDGEACGERAIDWSDWRSPADRQRRNREPRFHGEVMAGLYEYWRAADECAEPAGGAWPVFPRN